MQDTTQQEQQGVKGRERERERNPKSRILIFNLLLLLQMFDQQRTLNAGIPNSSESKLEGGSALHLDIINTDTHSSSINL